MTTEPESKLRAVYTNLKNYYVFDVLKFIKSFKLDMSKLSSIYLLNEEIEKTIVTQARLKKYKGVIYINKQLTEDTCVSFKQYFSHYTESIKYILIDNHYLPKHNDIMHLFDQVIFFDRFKKNKIIDCEGFIKKNDKVEDIVMDDRP